MSEIDQYIEKYCKKHEVTPEEARSHSVVKAVAEYYETVNVGKIGTIDGTIDGEISVTEINAGCGCIDEEDKSC